MAQQDNIIAAVPRKVYSNAHAYHIHSISVNSDQETYISADDLRINLWNLNISDQSFSECPGVLCCILLILLIDIVDIKPVNMEELTEVITATEFHPTHCNLFMYSSSKSNIKLADMRDSALCDQQSKCASHGATFCLSYFFSSGIGNRFRRRGRPNDAILLFRDYFLYLRRQIQSRWAIYSFTRLPIAQDMGRQHGVATREDNPDPRPPSWKALRLVREWLHFRQVWMCVGWGR